MNRTVAYQETSNNYTDTRQQIKGAQITTIKNFGIAPPSGGGDFIGQLGISADAQGNALLYTYGVGGLWQLVGQSGTANLPDTVVLEDHKNNFTEVDQRIEDCPIAYVEDGTRKPENVPIKGPGHMYVYKTIPEEVYISYDGTSWTPIFTSNAAGDVKLDAPNDFVNGDQAILGRQIVNIIKSSIAADASGVTPTREGELYIQLAEGTVDRKARMWISNNVGGWKWEPLTHIYELPATVAQTSKVNDFQATRQTIAGNQILSFIDGGDLTPGQSGAKPDYDGQFYLAVHTAVSGTKDVAIWVARGNQWLPIQQDIDLATVARTDKSNRFSEPEQILGEGGANARWLIGARTKFSGSAPISDNKWKVQNIGEITVYENNTVVPREMSVWVGISKNPNPDSNLNEWAMVWSSKQGVAANYARLDQENDFVPIQYLTSGGKRHQINAGHEGGAGIPTKSLVPVAPGDTYTQSWSHPSLGESRHLWMAANAADTESWKRVLCADDKDVITAEKQNNFLTVDNFIGSDTNTKRTRVMGSRINHQGGTAKGIMPTMFGEVLVCEEWDPNFPSDEDKKLVIAYLAVALNREGWLEIGRDLKKNLDYNGQDSNN